MPRLVVTTVAALAVSVLTSPAPSATLCVHQSTQADSSHCSIAHCAVLILPAPCFQVTHLLTMISTATGGLMS